MRGGDKPPEACYSLKERGAARGILRINLNEEFVVGRCNWGPCFATL